MTDNPYIACRGAWKTIKLEVARCAAAAVFGDHVVEGIAVAGELNIKDGFAAAAFVPGNLHTTDWHDLTKVKANPLAITTGTPTGVEFAVTGVAGRICILTGTG